MSIVPGMAQAEAADSAGADPAFAAWHCQIVQITTRPIATVEIHGVAKVTVGGGSICI